MQTHLSYNWPSLFFNFVMQSFDYMHVESVASLYKEHAWNNLFDL